MTRKYTQAYTHIHTVFASFFCFVLFSFGARRTGEDEILRALELPVHLTVSSASCVQIDFKCTVVRLPQPPACRDYSHWLPHLLCLILFEALIAFRGKFELERMATILLSWNITQGYGFEHAFEPQCVVNWVTGSLLCFSCHLLKGRKSTKAPRHPPDFFQDKVHAAIFGPPSRAYCMLPTCGHMRSSS